MISLIIPRKMNRMIGSSNSSSTCRTLLGTTCTNIVDVCIRRSCYNKNNTNYRYLLLASTSTTTNNTTIMNERRKVFTTTVSYLLPQQQQQQQQLLHRSPPSLYNHVAPSLYFPSLLQKQQQQQQQQQQHRTMSTKAETKKSKKDSNDNKDGEVTVSYWEQKKLDKDRRRIIYIARQERKIKVRNRRVGRPIDTKRIEFQKFYIKKKVSEEHYDRKARQAKLDWKIRVAVILERINIVLPDKEIWEKDYEVLKMHLQRYGKAYPKEFTHNFDYDQERPKTYEELIKELPFTPAPRETEADLSGDVRTLYRKLKTNIYLTIQEENKNNNNNMWQFPTVDVMDDETLLDAAKRALTNQIGTNVEYWCPSNCPWSVQLTPYTEIEQQQQEKLYGIKTFFMKLQHDEGDVIPEQMKGIADYAWLDRQEITDRIQQQQGDFESKLYYYML